MQRYYSNSNRTYFLAAAVSGVVTHPLYRKDAGTGSRAEIPWRTTLAAGCDKEFRGQRDGAGLK